MVMSHGKLYAEVSNFMPGLVWIDKLDITCGQYAVLLVVSCSALWAYAHPSNVRTDKLWSMCLFGLLLFSFFDHPFGIDVRTTWAALPNIPRHGWLSGLGFVNYLKFQPPLWTLWLLSSPWFVVQQVISICIGFTIFSLFYDYSGRRNAFLMLACPLFMLLSVQPSNDLVVCAILCFAVVYSSKKVLSCFLLCLACSLKYTVYALLPVLLLLMPIQTIGALGFVCMYWVWALSLNSFWPQEQWSYLLHSFTFGYISYYTRVSTSIPGTVASPVTLLHKITRTLSWRWETLGKTALWGSWWYLFPLYCVRVPFLVVLMWLVLLIGYGNIKYFSLCFPLFLFFKMRVHRCRKKKT